MIEEIIQQLAIGEPSVPNADTARPSPSKRTPTVSARAVQAIMMAAETIGLASSDEIYSPDVSFENVLVPFDGTALSLAALSTAQAIADRFAAQVHTIRIVRRAEHISAVRKDAEAALRALPGHAGTIVVSDIEPAKAIARAAQELGSCLVTMSTSGRGRFGGALLGSTATSVMSNLGPIVAVGPNAERPGWTPPPRRWPSPLTTRRMVACVDGSAESEAVLPDAAGWCRALGMSLSILMFIDDIPEPLRPDQRANRYQWTNDGNEYLQELAERWTEAVPAIDAVVAKEPIGPASGLRQHLDRNPAGLVAVSTQARSGLRRVIRGGTADSMVRASTAPCLVVPQLRTVHLR